MTECVWGNFLYYICTQCTHKATSHTHTRRLWCARVLSFEMVRPKIPNSCHIVHGTRQTDVAQRAHTNDAYRLIWIVKILAPFLFCGVSVFAIQTVGLSVWAPHHRWRVDCGVFGFQKTRRRGVAVFFFCRWVVKELRSDTVKMYMFLKQCTLARSN